LEGEYFLEKQQFLKSGTPVPHLPNLTATLKERNWEYTESFCNKIKRGLTEIRCGCRGVEFIHLAQKKARWWDLVNKVMKHSVP
jgi:hypothetical protein